VLRPAVLPRGDYDYDYDARHTTHEKGRRAMGTIEAEIVAVVEDGEIPGMPDLHIVRGWDPGAREWKWTVVEVLVPNTATGRGYYRPGTEAEAIEWARVRAEEYGWRKVSVHRTSAPAEGTALEAAWEQVLEIERGPWTAALGDGGREEEVSGVAEIYYATKEEMRGQDAALKARVTARLPGAVRLRYSHAVMGPGKVRMRCWLCRARE
jgi:hypothetical protein